MKCRLCDFKNPDTSSYCAHCGSSLLSNTDSPYDMTKTVHAKIKVLQLGSLFAQRYKISEELGRGGMGIVYKAEDTKLKRIVALKTLLPNVLTQTEDKTRFEHEARAAAALNHSNICTIYEIDEAEEHAFIAMEYVQGKSLKALVEERPTRISDALDFAIQITEGLRHAHERGIIHRDIKSSNIMIDDKQQAKIMDFGLAKSKSSTMLTREGTTLGTVAYMSPEQACGATVDFRSDIWSLGVVFYETLTGERPFQGEHDQTLIYAILNREPDPMTSRRSGLPLEFEKVVGKCMEKDINFRYQNASDLLADLKRLKRDWDAGKLQVASPISAPQQRPRPILDRLKIAALIAAPILALAVFYLLFLKPDKIPIQSLSQLSLIPLTTGSGLCMSPCWSPDGEWIAYASTQSGNMHIWKKPVQGGGALQLTKGPYNASQPDWSPDGRTIAFSSTYNQGGIFLIPASGGSPWKIADFGRNPTWSPDNSTLAVDWRGDIYLIKQQGNIDPQQVVAGTSATPHMAWTPDGTKLVFWNRTLGDIYVLSIASGASKSLRVVPTGFEVTGISLSADGQVLIVSMGSFGGNKNLWRVNFSPDTAEVIGEPFPMSVTPTQDIECDFSPDGTKLAFSAGQVDRHLWSYPLQSSSGMIAGEPEQLTFRCNNNYYPELSDDGEMLIWTSHITNLGVLCMMQLDDKEERKVTHEWADKVREVGGSFSPDANQICFASTLSGNFEVWLLPTLGGVGLPITDTEATARDTMTTWSPGGDRIAFYSNRSGNWDIWAVELGDKVELKQLIQWESNENYPAWSADGQWLSFRTDKAGNGDIWLMDADGSNPRAFVDHPAEEGWSAWSPDGRWFYFVSNRTGAYNIWVKPSGGGEERQVTTFANHSYGLPDFVLYTKFTVASDKMIVPLESRTGNIFIFENFK